MIIVDDHLALLAIAGALPELGDLRPVATTHGFHLRLARAVADSARTGALSRRLENAPTALNVQVGTERGANLLLAELVGAAVHHQAAVRVTAANMGRSWTAVMAATAVDFAAVEA